MSIANEVQRLQSAKQTLKTKINAKNDSSHQISNETLDAFGPFVDSIEKLKIFETVEEMNSDPDKHLGEKALVYGNLAKNTAYDMDFNTIYCPNTVTLPAHISSYFEGDDQVWEDEQTEWDSWEKYIFMDYMQLESDDDWENFWYNLGFSVGKIIPTEYDEDNDEYIEHPEDTYYYFNMGYSFRGPFYAERYNMEPLEEYEPIIFTRFTSTDGIHFTADNSGNFKLSGVHSTDEPEPEFTLYKTFTFNSSLNYSINGVNQEEWNDLYGQFIQTSTMKFNGAYEVQQNRTPVGITRDMTFDKLIFPETVTLPQKITEYFPDFDDTKLPDVNSGNEIIFTYTGEKFGENDEYYTINIYGYKAPEETDEGDGTGRSYYQFYMVADYNDADDDFSDSTQLEVSYSCFDGINFVKDYTRINIFDGYDSTMSINRFIFPLSVNFSVNFPDIEESGENSIVQWNDTLSYFLLTERQGQPDSNENLIYVLLGPKLQSKNATITTNGQTVIEPDENYDALLNANILTNISSGGIKLFSSVEAMNEDENKQLGDMAVVYNKSEIYHPQWNQDFQTLIVPDSFTLPKYVAEYFDPDDPDIWSDGYWDDDTGEYIEEKTEYDEWHKNLFDLYIDDWETTQEGNRIYLVGTPSISKEPSYIYDPENDEYITDYNNVTYKIGIGFSLTGPYYNSEYAINGERLTSIECTSTDGIHFTAPVNFSISAWDQQYESFDVNYISFHTALNLANDAMDPVENIEDLWNNLFNKIIKAENRTIGGLFKVIEDEEGQLVYEKIAPELKNQIINIKHNDSILVETGHVFDGIGTVQINAEIGPRMTSEDLEDYSFSKDRTGDLVLSFDDTLIPMENNSIFNYCICPTEVTLDSAIDTTIIGALIPSSVNDNPFEGTVTLTSSSFILTYDTPGITKTISYTSEDGLNYRRTDAPDPEEEWQIDERVEFLTNITFDSNNYTFNNIFGKFIKLFNNKSFGGIRRYGNHIRTNIIGGTGSITNSNRYYYTQIDISELFPYLLQLNNNNNIITSNGDTFIGKSLKAIVERINAYPYKQKFVLYTSYNDNNENIMPSLTIGSNYNVTLASSATHYLKITVDTAVPSYEIAYSDEPYTINTYSNKITAIEIPANTTDKIYPFVLSFDNWTTTEKILYISSSSGYPLIAPFTQTKEVTITTNGDTIIQPDDAYNYLDKVKITTNVSTENLIEKDVNFYDYDGTLLYSYTKSEFLALSTMPENPSHTGLVAQGWNWTLSDAKTYVTDYNELDIGQMYVTSSGLTEFDIELTNATGLTVTLNMNGTKNWGDGTSDTNTSHTYTNYGKYTISCNGDLVGDSYGVFENTGSVNNYYCTNIRLGNITAINNANFLNCTNVKTITLPNTITKFGGMVFAQCKKLQFIVIPNNLSTFVGRNFNGCYVLKNIIYPKNVPTPSALLSWYYQCYSLKKAIFPSSLTSIGNDFMPDCYNVNSIKIQSNISSMGRSTFSNCYSILLYDFTKLTAIPTLDNTNSFSGINKLAKIVVPDSLYTTWIVASNWVTYAEYIIKESDYNTN